MSGDGLHDGHRERMLKKFSEKGIDCFVEYEKLEVLLYSVYSRTNTNDISHRLLKRFGSLNGVMNATISELKEVRGVGEKAALKIRYLGDFYRALSMEKPKKIILTDTESTVTLCRSFLTFNNSEYMVALFLDNRNTLIGRFDITDCRPNSVGIQIKKLSLKVVESQCSYVILVHTHIDIPTLPSESDYITTRKIANILNVLDVKLIDHIIISPKSDYSMRTWGDLKDLWT